MCLGTLPNLDIVQESVLCTVDERKLARDRQKMDQAEESSKTNVGEKEIRQEYSQKLKLVETHSVD